MKGRHEFFSVVRMGFYSILALQMCVLLEAERLLAVKLNV